MATPAQVLSYWFLTGCDADEERYWRQIRWWFDGGPEVDRDIAERFLGTLEGAVRGELDPWSETPRGRLALIIVLDQFSRNVYRGRPEAYAQDPTAQALALSGLDARMERTLSLGDRMFFLLPLGHAEVLALHDRAQPYVAQIVEPARAHYTRSMRSLRSRHAPTARPLPGSGGSHTATSSWAGPRPPRRLSS